MPAGDMTAPTTFATRHKKHLISRRRADARIFGQTDLKKTSPICSSGKIKVVARLVNALGFELVEAEAEKGLALQEP